MKLTARQAARLLAVTETDVYRWVDAGSIPYHLANHQPLFARTELLEWATARRLRVSPELFQDEENGQSAGLADSLERGGIHRGVGGGTREQVLRAAVDCLPALDPADRALLCDLLAARGSAGASGIGEGIAVPHVRSPVVWPGGRAAVALCFLGAPLDIGAADRLPVHTLFLIVSPTIAQHLQLLSKLSLALLDPAFKQAVAGRAPDGDILGHARRVESGLLTPPPTGTSP